MSVDVALRRGDRVVLDGDALDGDERAEALVEAGFDFHATGTVVGPVARDLATQGAGEVLVRYGGGVLPLRVVELRRVR